MEEIDIERRAGDREVANWIAAAPIVVLVMRVEGNREKAPGLPLESLFFSGVEPYTRRSRTLDDVHHLFVEVPLRFQFLARRNHTDICVIDAAGSFKIDERAEAALELPGRNVDCFYIVNVEAGDSRNLLRVLPQTITIDRFRSRRFR